MIRIAAHIIGFILILSSYSPSNAQKMGEARLYIGLEATPGIGFRSLKNPGTDFQIDNIIRVRNENETPVQNISLGLSAGLQLSPHFELGVGFRYATKGLQLRADFIPMDSFNTALPNSIQIIDRYRYFEIPVQATYIIFRGDRQFFVTGEIYWNSLNNLAIITYKRFDDGVDKQKEIISIDNGPTSFLGTGIQFGVQRSFSDRFSIRVAPGIRWDWISLSNPDLLQFHWNAGVNLSGQFKW